MIPYKKHILTRFYFFIFLIIFISVGSNIAQAQNKYGFDFEKDWLWADLLSYKSSSSEVITSSIKYLMNEYTIEEARLLFRQLIKLDSLNEILLLPEIARYDLERNKIRWETKISKGLKGFDERNTFAGIITSATTLSVIRRPFLFSGKSFKNRDYNISILEFVNLNVKLNFDYTGANEILDLLEKDTNTESLNKIIDKSGLLQTILSTKCKPSITQKEFIQCIKNSKRSEPLFILYKLINPTSFFDLGGIYLYKKNFRELLTSLRLHEGKIKYESLRRLSLYFPKKLSFTSNMFFLLGNNGDCWEADENRIGIDLEYFGDDYESLIRSITRELYFHALKENQLNVYPYLVDNKDTLVLKAMTKVFNGGTANHIAPTLQENRPAYLLEKDFLFFNKTINTIRKKKNIELIDSLIHVGSHERGPFNTMGTQMANSIEKVLGKEALKKSLKLGPVYFFNRYIDAYDLDSKNIRSIFQFTSKIEDEILSLVPIFPESIFIKVLKLKKYKNDSAKLLSQINKLSGKYKKDKNYFVFNLLAGQLLFESGYYKDAYTFYEKSIKNLPNKIKAIKELGFLFYDKKAYDESLGMFNLYIQYCPNEADAYECRGLLYYTVEDYEKAKMDYEKALSILPNLENAKYMLKKINAKLSESDES